MKMIRSFAVALAMFLCFVMITHAVCATWSLKTDHEKFGLWFNNYKDQSQQALAANMNKDTVLLMGSSEFRHGRTTEYHPRSMFSESAVDLMSIGGPYNQTLFHTVAMGSLDKALKSKKVVLLVSTTWFRETGVKSADYALRFSESEYLAFMKNKMVPKKTRAYVAKRSELLLKESNKNSYDKVRLINDRLLRGKNDPITRVRYRLEELLSKDRDTMTTGVAIRLMMNGSKAGLIKPQERRDQEGNILGQANKDLIRTATLEDWKALSKEAEQASQKKSHNMFGMSDKVWKKEYCKKYKKLKGSHDKDSYDRSPEYRDMQAFLEICKANGIKAKLLILPVNGYWYDYTGMTPAKRAVVSEKLSALAQKYGAEAVSMSKYDYQPHITTDAVHPWNEGWVKINEEIAKFCYEG